MSSVASESMAKRTWVGQVVSSKMQKTVVVLVETKVKHPRYHKYVTRHKKFYAHDEASACGIGDEVVIEECRPLSRTKRWAVCEIRKKNTAL